MKILADDKEACKITKSPYDLTHWWDIKHKLIRLGRLGRSESMIVTQMVMLV